MKTYFVVLQLPGSEELKLGEGHLSPYDFWTKAKKSIATEQCEIVSIRRDTGISEDLRQHLAGVENFTTYIIFHANLSEAQAQDKHLLYNVALNIIDSAQRDVMVDSGEHFQVLSIDQHHDHPNNNNGHAA